MGVRSEFADNEWRNTGTTDDFVSYLPCNSAVASTWNRELAGEEGRVLGEEARGRGKDSPRESISSGARSVEEILNI